MNPNYDDSYNRPMAQDYDNRRGLNPHPLGQYYQPRPNNGPDFNNNNNQLAFRNPGPQGGYQQGNQRYSSQGYNNQDYYAPQMVEPPFGPIVGQHTVIDRWNTVERVVPVEREVAVPMPYPVEKAVPVRVPVPYEKRVEVPVPYPVEKIVEVPVDRPVPYPVDVPVPVGRSRTTIYEESCVVPQTQIVESEYIMPAPSVFSTATSTAGFIAPPPPMGHQTIINNIYHTRGSKRAALASLLLR